MPIMHFPVICGRFLLPFTGTAHPIYTLYFRDPKMCEGTEVVLVLSNKEIIINLRQVCWQVTVAATGIGRNNNH